MSAFWILYISVYVPSFCNMGEPLVPRSRENRLSKRMNDKRRMGGRVGGAEGEPVLQRPAGPIHQPASVPREAVVPVEEAARPSWGPIGHRGGRGWLLDTAV